MENQENILREMLTRLGLDGDEMFSSDTLSEKEKINLLNQLTKSKQNKIKLIKKKKKKIYTISVKQKIKIFYIKN